MQEAAPAAATGAPRAEGFDLDLAGAASVWLSPATLLLSLASGQLVLLMIQQEAALVRRLKVPPCHACYESWVLSSGWVVCPEMAACREAYAILCMVVLVNECTVLLQLIHIHWTYAHNSICTACIGPEADLFLLSMQRWSCIVGGIAVVYVACS